jgi:hypothetical protein
MAVTDMTDSNPLPLPPDLQRRQWEAEVAKAEADAKKAALDAASSSFTLAQSQLKSLVPDLSGVNLNTVDDKTTDVAFSGVITYTAVANAAMVIAERIESVILKEGRQSRVLVTSEQDLISADTVYETVLGTLADLAAFADSVLADTATPERPAELVAAPQPHDLPLGHRSMMFAATPILGLAAGAGLAALTGGIAPLALAAGSVVASAVPSLLSLLSTTTTIKDHTEQISDLAAASAVIAEISRLPNLLVTHDDFRLMPTPPEEPSDSTLAAKYHALSRRRTDLLLRKAALQEGKNDADLRLARAMAAMDAENKKADDAKQPAPPPPDELATATRDSANSAALIALTDAAIGGIDAFTAAIGSASAGIRPPITIALLAETLRLKWIDYVLMVKSLGGQSQEVLQDRHLGADTYTILGDASIDYLLLDVETGVLASAGVVTGLGVARGKVGEIPTVNIAPMATDAGVATAATARQDGQPTAGSGNPPAQKHTRLHWPPHWPWRD